MGNLHSRPDEGSGLYIRDQTRFSIAGVHITNARGQTLLRAGPNGYPATGYKLQKELGDDTPVEYVQDPETLSSGTTPSFLIRLANVDELTVNFTLILRQQSVNGASSNGSKDGATQSSMDTNITGLTYIFASNPKEVDNLVTREFHSNPNLHKNPNVELIGDFTTGGSPAVQFDWTWKWRPPKQTEDRCGGWRNCCSFAEYNQRANSLDSLATFNFWVQNSQRSLPPVPKSSRAELTVPSRLRLASSQSVDSRISGNISDSEGEGSYKDWREPQSPTVDVIPENGLGLCPTMASSNSNQGSAVKVDVATRKFGGDPALNEDGPLFRATMRSLEQKTGNMRLRMKKVLRTAEAAEEAQRACNQAVSDFTDALRDAASSNANAVKPALDHYFEKIAREILHYERQNTINLQKIIIEPISKLYNIEIKQADYKKREFDEESKEYYAFVGKYLGQRSESLKEKKQKQSDEKYQAKRRTFELKRFDYSSFMHDLHGGRKDQEVLSQLTKYADAQARGYLSAAKKVEEMVPQLDALIAEVKTADQDFQLQRSEREEKRRILEKSSKMVGEDGTGAASGQLLPPGASGPRRQSEADNARAVSSSGLPAYSQSPPSTATLAVQAPSANTLVPPANPAAQTVASPSSKFKGFRDLEESNSANVNGGAFRKEGLLWALSKPGSHVDPRGINKAAWHKFWIVLDQGKLSEYVNWKDKLDLHIDPIDLRVASVREARNAERRFCFEVITPQYTRVYQAPSEEDMKSWIAAINNALQSAFEARSNFPSSPSPVPSGGSTRKDIAAVLTGKSSSFSGHRAASNPNRSEANKAVGRHATTGERPSYKRTEASEAELSALLQRVRTADEGNKVCADCGSESKVDWCSINLGILLCIECSGIHRSLGTHISKVRSLTLDTSAFTPDSVEILLLVGNRVSNMVWEAKLDSFLKPSPHSTREQRLHFITAKYGDRTYVQPPPGSQAPDDHLLTSIKRNEIQSVLHALALRANPNAHDRSRSTHAIYLALAAADPASPASAGFGHHYSQSTSAIRVSPTSPAIPSRPSTPPASSRKPFPVAELLIQNGADIPTHPAPFPLSDAAKQYLEFKSNQRLGKTFNNSAGTRDAHGDQLSALPTIPPAGTGASATTPEQRERLLKRHNSGRPSRPSMAADAIENFVKK